MARRSLAGSLKLDAASLKVVDEAQPALDLALPDDAYVVSGISGVLVNAYGIDDALNWKLCNQLRGRELILLEDLRVSGLPQLQLRRGRGESLLDALQLTQSLHSCYKIRVKCVVTPADAELARSLTEHAGAGYRQLIEPLLKELAQGEVHGAIEHHAVYRKNNRLCNDAINRFIVRFATHAHAGRHLLGEALRHFLHEHAAHKKPLVYLDDDAGQLTKVFNLCKQEGWEVRCYKVDATKPAIGVQAFTPWQEQLRRNLCDYVIQRGADPREFKHHLFGRGLGVSKTIKLRAARELLSLIEGGEPEVILYKEHDDYAAYMEALSQAGRDLLSAIKHDELPTEVTAAAATDLQLVQVLIDVLHGQAVSRRPALQAAHIVT